jgi:hypothetical protein
MKRILAGTAACVMAGALTFLPIADAQTPGVMPGATVTQGTGPSLPPSPDPVARETPPVWNLAPRLDRGGELIGDVPFRGVGRLGRDEAARNEGKRGNVEGGAGEANASKADAPKAGIGPH